MIPKIILWIILTGIIVEETVRMAKRFEKNKRGD